ncbi:putative L,D-transpeptidase YkuD [compost metagenome]
MLVKKVLLLICLMGLVLHSSPTQAYPIEDSVTIIIRKSTRLLTVYVNETPIRTFRVATGKGNLTPEGEFSIVNKIKNPWYIRKQIPGGSRLNPLGSRWLGLSVPHTGGFKYGIHGTNNPYSIGQNVTSGCIRMGKRDVEWLYRHIPIGTKVVITK